MPTFNELGAEPMDKEDKIETFRLYSRQVLYTSLFENDDLDIHLFDEDTDFGAEFGEGEPDDFEDEDVEAAGDEEDYLDRFKEFSRYLFQELGEGFRPPDELTTDEWAELANEMLESEQESVDLAGLAERLYALFKRELRIEGERLARRI